MTEAKSTDPKYEYVEKCIKELARRHWKEFVKALYPNNEETTND